MKAASMRASQRWPVPTLTLLMNDADRKARLSFAIFWAMRERHVKPPALAKAIGRSDDTIRRWLDDDGSTPSALDLAPLAEALGVRVDYFTNPPDLPAYPFADYVSADPPTLIAQARESGAEEGARRFRRRPVPPDPEAPVPSPPRHPRGSGARRA